MVTGGAVPSRNNELNWHFLEKIQPLEKHHFRVSNLTPGEDLSQASLHADFEIYSTRMTTWGSSLPCTYTLEVIKYWRGWRPGRWGCEGQLYPNKGHREAQQRRKCCLQFPSSVKSRYATQWLQVHLKGNFLSPSPRGEPLFTFHYGPLCTVPFSN